MLGDNLNRRSVSRAEVGLVVGLPLSPRGLTRVSVLVKKVEARGSKDCLGGSS